MKSAGMGLTRPSAELREQREKGGWQCSKAGRQSKVRSLSCSLLTVSWAKRVPGVIAFASLLKRRRGF